MKLSVVFSTLLLLAAAHTSWGQIPTITGVQPESGLVGSPVTIGGTNFGTEPANVAVFFGTLPAVVTSITPDAITTTVPAGAAHERVFITFKNTAATIASARPFLVTFDGEREIRPGYFLPKVDLTVGTGTNPRNLAAGDLDGDGNIDLVTANQGTKTIAIFHNVRTDAGPVTATTFSAPLYLAAGEVATVAIADLDGDGKPEIIGTNAQSGRLLVFKNTTTRGVMDATSFQAKIEFGMSGTDHAVAVGDLNDDGKPDIVVSNAFYGRVLVYQNASIGNQLLAASFSNMVTLQVFANGVSKTREVSLGDVDGDGKMDIVVGATEGSADVAVLRNLGGTTITTASFAAPVTFIAGTGPANVSLADTDRNGVLDIVTANVNSITVGLSLNRNVSGTVDKTLLSRQEYNIGAVPVKLAIADFDGDGFPDAATANNSTTRSIAVFENSNVPGSPLTNIFFTRADLVLGTTPTGLVAADLNGDGKPDLATVNSGTGILSIFTNNNVRVTPPPVISAFAPDNGNFSDEVVITGQNFNGRPTNNLVKFNGRIAKVLSASPTALTVAVPAFATTGKITVQVNGFETATSIPDFQIFQIPSITDFGPTKGPIGTTVTIRGANFSATTAENVVYFGATKAVVTAATATELIVSVPAGATYEPISVAVHAMVAYSDKPFTVTFAGGTFTPEMFPGRALFTSGISFPSDATTGDVDGDGKTDVLLTGSRGGVVVFRNTSTAGGAIGSSTFATPYTVPGIPTTDGISHIALEDLDLDGKLDLLACASGSVLFSRNLSAGGSLSFAAPVTVLPQERAGRLVVADMDLDGKPDLVYASNDETVRIARNTTVRGKPLSFATPVQYTLPAHCWDVAVKDIDDDGKPDIICTNQNGYVGIIAVFKNRALPMTIDAAAFAPYVSFAVVSNPQALALADYDGDGKPDMAASSYAGGGSESLVVLQNTGHRDVISSSSFAPQTVWPMPSSADVVRAADLDGDGRPEIAQPTCGYSYCSVSVFRNTGSPGAPLASCFDARKEVGQMANQHVLEIADLNGDGRPELLTVRATPGNLYDLVVMENKPTAPTITNFTPIAGPVGTVISITGSRFSTTANLNTVSINGAPAQVTNATATSLTVVVPDDAITGPITIAANGQTYTSGQEFTVTRIAQRITFTMPSSVKIDQTPFTLSGTASSGLDVVYTSSNPDVAIVTGNTVTIGGSGITTITASQPGTIYYAPAEAVSHPLTVEKLEQAISFSALPEKQVGDEPMILAATASSGLPVTYTSSDATVATISGYEVKIIAAGTTTVTALQPGNTWFAAALPAEQQFIVQKPDVITGTEGGVITRSIIVPNPVSSWAVILLKNTGSASAISIRIFDSNGRVVATRHFDYGEELKLDLSTFTNGLYNIDVRNGTKNYSARFAVMH